MAAGSTYTPIATTTLGSAAASYTFSSIPGTYTDLVLIGVTNNSGGNNQVYIRVGNATVDSGSNYSYTELYGDGTSAVSSRSSSQTNLLIGLTDATTTSPNSNFIANIQNYSNTTTYKTVISRSNAPARASEAIVGLWRSTSAINIITLSAGSSTIIAGSTFTLYGIAAA
jgi:hypothetical protein